MLQLPELSHLRAARLQQVPPGILVRLDLQVFRKAREICAQARGTLSELSTEAVAVILHFLRHHVRGSK